MHSWLRDYDDIGAVEFRLSGRARRMRLAVTEDLVRLTIPQGHSPKTAEAWLRQHTAWIMDCKVKQARLREDQTSAGLIVTAPPDRAAAQRQLTARLAELAELHGLSYARASVRNQKTRWGSCSSAGNISLNSRLVKLPAELRDYVILHELAHLKIHGHGPDFWRELGQLVDNPRQLRRRLRQYHIV